MTWLADRANRLALLGALCLFGQILLFGPLEIWARNAPFMGFSGFLHAAAFATLTIVVLTAAVIAWQFVPHHWRSFAASIVAAIAIVVWIYAQFLFVDNLQLNGRETPLAFSAPIGGWEWLLILVAVAVLARIAKRRTREVTVALVILLAAQSGWLAYQLVSARRFGVGLATPDLKPLWRTAKSGNVVIFLLDTLQSDVGREALSKRGLARAFDGFVFYSKAASVARTTYPTVPVIHSGEPWDPETNLIDRYETSVRKGSFLAQLGTAGYQVVQLNPIFVCVDGATLCTNSITVLGHRRIGFALEMAKLLDLSALRAIPFAWKAGVFNGGNLFVTYWLRSRQSGQFRLDDLEVLKKLTANAAADDGPKSAKFIHLFTTHPPFVFGANCRPDPSPGPDGPRFAAVCSLQEIARYLAKLKAAGSFDQTLVIVMADHGGLRVDPSIADANWAALLSYATPTLMVHLPGAQHPLQFSDVPASVSDIAATVCEALGQCKARGGVALQQLNSAEYENRRRTYRHYTWEADGWSMARVRDLKSYDIIGPVDVRAAWRNADAAVRRYSIGERIDFRDDGADEFLEFGWSGAEDWGRWTSGKRSRLLLPLDSAPPGDLTLVVRGSALVGEALPRQTIDILVNGEPVGAWTFDSLQPVEKSVRIPAAVLHRSQVVTIDFVVQTIMTPHDLGLTSDTRTLGFAVNEAKLAAN